MQIKALTADCFLVSGGYFLSSLEKVYEAFKASVLLALGLPRPPPYAVLVTFTLT